MALPDAEGRRDGPLDERAAFRPVASMPAVARRDSPDALPARLLLPERRQRGISAYLAIPPGRPPRASLRQAFVTAVEIEWDRGAAFLFVPVCLAAGALVYFNLEREPSFAQLGAPLALAVLLAWLARRRLFLRVGLVALSCFLAGLFVAKIETWRADTKMLGGEISTRLTGRVVTIELQADKRIRLTLDVISTDRPQLKYVPDRLRVSARSIPEKLRAGEVVVGVARIAPPSGPTRPGGYDFSFVNYFNGIGANGFFLKQPERIPDGPPMNWKASFSANVENLRTDLGDRIRSAIGGPEGEIAAALVAGVRAGIPEDVNETLRRTGLAHILSISGLHMALVAATIMFALRAGFALFPGLSSRRPVKKYAAAIGLVALSAYLFISGSAVAAERSFLMLGVMLLAVIFDRAALTMRNLAIAAIVIIVVSPHEVTGPSFQMSFAATAALIGAYAGWSERRQRAVGPVDGGVMLKGVRKAAGYTIGLIVTSLVAGTATAVFGAYHFQRIAPLGLVANLAAMPIVSVLVMPSALFGVLLMPFGLDHWAFAVMGVGLRAMIYVADWVASLSTVDSVGLIPAAPVLVLTLALIAATLSTTWLRIIAVPIAAAGVMMIAARSLPDALISEDGRLVAVHTVPGSIAVNRPRPNAFTTEDWQRALNAGVVLKRKVVSEEQKAGDVEDGIFLCVDEVCSLRLNGQSIVHVSTASTAKPHCVGTALIVIDDATAKDICSGSGAVVVTKRDLAKRGGASVILGQGTRRAAVTFAIREPYRPWHAHRAFSREARGLASYERPESPPAPLVDNLPDDRSTAVPVIAEPSRPDTSQEGAPAPGSTQ